MRAILPQQLVAVHHLCLLLVSSASLCSVTEREDISNPELDSLSILCKSDASLGITMNLSTSFCIT